MRLLLLCIALLSQGVPIQPNQGGTVTGTLRDSEGKPLAGVRIAAVAAGESPTDAAEGVAMSAIAETDADGRYRLENVPPGRYYVSAGRLDLPTYFPGTLDMKAGTTVAITPGAIISEIDFSLRDDSTGRAPSHIGVPFAVGRVSIPMIQMDVRVEGGGQVPVFGSAGLIFIEFTPSAGGATMFIPIDVPSLSLTGSATEYRVAVRNLPPEYALKSLTYGATDLQTDTLKLSASSVTTAVWVFAPMPSNASPNSMTGFVSPGLQTTRLAPTSLSPTSPLSIVLETVPGPAAETGVRVTGSTKGGARSVYLSGVPGIYFADGTFEFRGVPPGRHSVVTLDNPLSGIPQAASVVVGDRDVEGIELENTPTLPMGIRTAKGAEPAGAHIPGSKVPLATLRGIVRDSGTGQPISGQLFLSGGAYGASSTIGEDGRFEVRKLLPGEYVLEVLVFHSEPLKRTVVVGDDGANLEIEIGPARR